MEKDFWHDRWRLGQIAFHQPEVETYLHAHFGRLEIPEGATVLVPLCGKSRDLAWLASQGYKVVGVELSPIACKAFFTENKIPAARPVRKGPFRIHRSKDGAVTIYEGDFFELASSHTGPVAAFYDRAALIALPPPMRKRYVRHLKNQLLEPTARGLLVTVAYDQRMHSGPPFSVPPAEVKEHWGKRFRIKLVGRGPEQAGPVMTTESSWLLTPLAKAKPKAKAKAKAKPKAKA